MKISSVGFLSGVCYTILVNASSTLALTLIPPSLPQGSQYRLVFVTSNGRNATSNRIADYNTFVNATANTISSLTLLGTNWSAIASDPLITATLNTSTIGTGGVPIYRLDGVKVADNYPDLWDGSLDNPINVTEQGQILNVPAWTGTLSNGENRVQNALGGTELQSIFGNSSISTQGWVSSGTDFKSVIKPLYAISGLLTIPQLPTTTTEPNSYLGYIIFVALILCFTKQDSNKSNALVHKIFLIKTSVLKFGLIKKPRR
jgi:hypothetical protein